MNIFIYIIIGMIGVLFGSFFTLAVHRIPKGDNIIYKRSYCPKCNHRLEFWDLIPVISYLFLGGKCRYCKEPISKRYILFEIFSGVVFVIVALLMNISIYSSFENIITYVYTMLIISVLYIICGIGKNINLSVILVGILIRTTYLVMFDIQEFRSIYLETILYLISGLILYLLVYAYLKDKKEDYKEKLKELFNIVIYISFLIFALNSNLVMVILLVTLVIAYGIKLVAKKDIDYVSVLSIITIVLFVVISNSNMHEYINLMLS